ncbi:MAG TPA: hypothetical protein VID50_03230, partial [Candidatus Eisenbacteria bacterium]
MIRRRWLGAGLALLMALLGCSKEGKKITKVGSYAPVIVGVHVDREPAVRGRANQVTVLVTNVNAIPLQYHWRASGGTLQDSTGATVTWDAPDTIGSFELYVSVEGDDPNMMHYFREQTYPMFVDNEYERWTSGEAIKFDVAPPGNQDPDPTHPLLYAEFDNPTTGASHVAAVSSPLGATASLSEAFFAAASPTLRGDASQVAFAGRTQSIDLAPSIYLIPKSGSGPDTTTAIPVARYRPTTAWVPPGGNLARLLANPRFARSGTMLAYNSDSITSITSSGKPHIYLRDAADYEMGNFSAAPQPVVTGSGEINNWYWNPNWNGAGDSLVCESYSNRGTVFEVKRGLFKLLAAPPFQATATLWLPDPDAQEIDWSPDGAHMAFTRKNPAGDRDLWITRSDAASPTQAVRVTMG